MSPAERIEAAVGELSRALRAVQPRSMVIGGIAAILHGVPRVTRDVDVAVEGAGTDLERLLADLSSYGVTPRVRDAAAFARQSQVLLLQHDASGVEIDLCLAWLPFEVEAIDNAIEVSVGDSVVRIVRPEDLVIYKFTAWRPQDQQDVERLLALHAHAMDLTRVRRLAAEIAAALDEPDRLDEFERLVPTR